MLNEERYLDKRVIKTRKVIKGAFLSLLHVKSFEDISIADIVNKGEISRVTFYNHYKNKQALLNDMIHEVLTELIHAFRQPYRRLKRFKLIDIEPSAIPFFETIYRNSCFYTAIIHSDILPIFQHRLIECFTQLQLDDLKMQNKHINPALYAGYQAYAITGLIIEWVKSGFTYSPKYMAEQLVGIITVSSKESFYIKT